jgi:hypothetical protein
MKDLTMKTAEEIENLKKSWMRDSCWDIETTEGFEEHHDELLKFRKDCEAEGEKKAIERTLSLRKKWFELEINESFQINNYVTVTRVPNGWIYSETMCTKEPSGLHSEDAIYTLVNTFIPEPQKVYSI